VLQLGINLNDEEAFSTLAADVKTIDTNGLNVEQALEQIVGVIEYN
jgi:hypothetical protein